jgi:hypothetical protein
MWMNRAHGLVRRHSRRMPRIRPLPSSLLDGPFTIDTARSAGVGRGRLRGDDLERTYWGLRTTAPLVDVEARCRLLALRMPPGSFFSHVTAALVHGIPVPIALEHDLTIHVSVAPPARAPHARHLRGHRLAIQPHDVVTLRGLDVTTAIRTWCDLGAVLTLFDLVAAGDFIIHHRNPPRDDRRSRARAQHIRQPSRPPNPAGRAPPAERSCRVPSRIEAACHPRSSRVSHGTDQPHGDRQIRRVRRADGLHPR